MRVLVSMGLRPPDRPTLRVLSGEAYHTAEETP
jgi:hypothetical protein